jgi:hypothetical protein
MVAWQPEALSARLDSMRLSLFNFQSLLAFEIFLPYSMVLIEVLRLRILLIRIRLQLFAEFGFRPRFFYTQKCTVSKKVYIFSQISRIHNNDLSPGKDG